MIAITAPKCMYNIVGQAYRARHGSWFFFLHKNVSRLPLPSLSLPLAPYFPKMPLSLSLRLYRIIILLLAIYDCSTRIFEPK